MYWTSLIYSSSSEIYYIGQANNLEDRLMRHNGNRNKYTRNKGPWELVFSQEFSTRSEAMALEKKLKSFKNPTYLYKFINGLSDAG